MLAAHSLQEVSQEDKRQTGHDFFSQQGLCPQAKGSYKVAAAFQRALGCSWQQQ